MLVKLLDEQLQDVSGGWGYSEEYGVFRFGNHNEAQEIKSALGKMSIIIEYVSFPNERRSFIGPCEDDSEYDISGYKVKSLGVFRNNSEIVDFLRTKLHQFKEIK